jgi:hypothetical protein
LAKLKAVFQKGGSTTAGNALQVTDGTAAVLAMKRSTAQKLGLPIQGVFRSFAVVGCAPDEMGVGPAYAIPPALKAARLGIADIGVYEINEAFASQAVYCVKKLGIPLERVNPRQPCSVEQLADVCDVLCRRPFPSVPRCPDASAHWCHSPTPRCSLRRQWRIEVGNKGRAVAHACDRRDLLTVGQLHDERHWCVAPLYPRVILPPRVPLCSHVRDVRRVFNCASFC